MAQGIKERNRKRSIVPHLYRPAVLCAKWEKGLSTRQGGYKEAFFSRVHTGHMWLLVPVLSSLVWSCKFSSRNHFARTPEESKKIGKQKLFPLLCEAWVKNVCRLETLVQIELQVKWNRAWSQTWLKLKLEHLTKTWTSIRTPATTQTRTKIKTKSKSKTDSDFDTH